MEFIAPEPLDVTEALKSSPIFRWQLSQHEEYIKLMETKINEFVRCTTDMIDKGKLYVAAYQAFLKAADDMNASCFQQDSALFQTLKVILNVLEELSRYQKVLIEQAYWSLVKNFSDFCNRDLNKVHDAQNHFLRVDRSLDEALAKSAGVSKSKEQESFEAQNELTAVGTCFAHSSLDYIYQINMMHATKKHKITEAFLSYVSACETYFHQGYDLFGDEWSTTKETLNGRLVQFKNEERQVEKKMQDRHAIVPKEIFEHPPGMPLDPEIVVEGYLFKRSSKAIKTWNRRWFMVKDNKFLYCHREVNFSANADDSLNSSKFFTVMEADLRLCLVRPLPASFDRRNCFEIVSPYKSHILQADSESLCLGWIKALQRTIESALHDCSVSEMYGDQLNTESLIFREKPGSFTTSTSSTVAIRDNRVVAAASPKHPVLDRTYGVAGNEFCADCGSKNPKWASINFGVTLCIECCAIHRSLSVQVSKVRSLVLDDWEQEHIRMMTSLGNVRVNRIYLELSSAVFFPRPVTVDSTRAERKAWIVAKYVQRRFVRHLDDVHDLLHLLAVFDRSSIRRFPVVSSSTVRYAKLSALKRSYSYPSVDGIIRSQNADVTFTDSRVIKLPLRRRVSASVSFPLTEESFSDFLLQLYKRALACNELLLTAVRANDLLSMAKRIAQGADVDYRGIGNGCRSALHEAVIVNSIVCCEYLLLNGARLNAQDLAGDTPLHLAVKLGHTGIVCLLLRRGANQDLLNCSGESPLAIATELADADIVTMLRLAKLREEIKTTEAGSSNDVTVADVFRDFTDMANRRQSFLDGNEHGQADVNS